MDSQWESVRRSVEARAARMKVSRLVLAQELEAGLTGRWHLEAALRQMKPELHRSETVACSVAS